MSADAVAIVTNARNLAPKMGQRLGQFVYNGLPDGAKDAIVSTHIDPFYKDYSEYEIEAWIDNHLIFDKGVIVAVFDEDTILWDRDDPDMAVPAIVRS